MNRNLKLLCTRLHNLGVLLTNLLLSLLYFLSHVCLPVTKAIVTNVLYDSDIRVNGSRSSDPKVVDDRFYCLFAKYSYTGFIDAYQFGYFECEDLPNFFLKIVRSKHYQAMCYHPAISFRSLLFRYLGTIQDSSVFDAYDDGAWFSDKDDEDECKSVSTGYWTNANSIEEADIEKNDLIARKLKLKPRMRVVDLGCGEGPLCIHLAKHFDVDVTGVTMPAKIYEKAKKLSKGLNIKYELMDARYITGKYDRIVAVGLTEHLGELDMRDLFKTIHDCLTDDGIFLLENYTVDNSYTRNVDVASERTFGMPVFYHRYSDVMKAIDGLFVLEDYQNLRNHCARTSKAWVAMSDQDHYTLVAKYGQQHVRAVKALDAELYALCAGGQLQVCHLVFSKNGLKDGYDPVV